MEDFIERNPAKALLKFPVVLLNYGTKNCNGTTKSDHHPHTIYIHYNQLISLMNRSIVAAAVLLLAAGQASAGVLPPASKSIKYTDEPDPAIYAAAQASAAAIAYGPSVLLKGPPSGGGLVQPSSLEAQDVPEEVPVETPANPAAGGGGYGEEAAPSAASVVADPAAAAAAGGYGTEKTTTEAAPSVDTTTTSSPVSGEGADTAEATPGTTPETTTAAAPSVDTTTTTSPISGGEGADTTIPSVDTTNPTPAENAAPIEKPSTPTSSIDDSSTADGTTVNAPAGDVTSSDMPAHSAAEEQTPEAFSDVNRRLRR